MTRQRELIYNIIMAEPRHRTAEEIYTLAARQMPGIARGTVYRNLGLMVEAGEIRKLELSGGAYCYDRTPQPHGHLICRRCGAVKDLMADGLLEKASAFAGEPVTDCDLKFYYLCEKCRQEEI